MSGGIRPADSARARAVGFPSAAACPARPLAAAATAAAGPGGHVANDPFSDEDASIFSDMASFSIGGVGAGGEAAGQPAASARHE